MGARIVYSSELGLNLYPILLLPPSLAALANKMSLKTCCASGSLHTGIPTGRIKKMHGLDCYVAAKQSHSGRPVCKEDRRTRLSPRLHEWLCHARRPDGFVQSLRQDRPLESTGESRPHPVH